VLTHVKHLSLLYFGDKTPVEQVEVLMVMVVDDLMTKLNNLTKA